MLLDKVKARIEELREERKRAVIAVHQLDGAIAALEEVLKMEGDGQ